MKTNDATRASAEAMPTENGVSDLLQRAIERHDAAFAYFSSTCYLSDSGVMGREATAEEAAIYDAASDIEKQALSDVCYFPVSSPEDYAAKARHLRKYHAGYFGGLEDWQVENLLRSMLPEVERDQIEDDDSGLASLIASCRRVTDRINLYEGGGNDPEIGEACDEQCKLALAICGYRPSSDDEMRRKAEFLRKWTADTLLSGEEQKALIASMLPEGGAA